jgi:hypothetical protein
MFRGSCASRFIIATFRPFEMLAVTKAGSLFYYRRMAGIATFDSVKATDNESS